MTEENDEKEKIEAERKKAEENAAAKEKDANDNSNNGGEAGKKIQGSSDLDKAINANKVKSELLDREEKLLERKEKLEGIRLIGGGSAAGSEPAKPKDETDSEYRGRVEKEMASGKT